MSKKPKCECPIHCRYCGAQLRRDHIGHYCPTQNCQWQFGVKDCTLYTTGRRAAANQRATTAELGWEQERGLRMRAELERTDLKTELAESNHEKERWQATADHAKAELAAAVEVETAQEKRIAELEQESTDYHSHLKECNERAASAAQREQELQGQVEAAKEFGDLALRNHKRSHDRLYDLLTGGKGLVEKWEERQSLSAADTDTSGYYECIGECASELKALLSSVEEK